VPELAAVLGHETAHLLLGHVSAQQKQVKSRRDIFARVGRLFGGSGPSQNAVDAAQLASNYTFLNFTRQQEFAADQLGSTLAARAGYDPWGTVWFASEVERLDGDAGYESYVQHHPSTKERISRVESYFKAHPATFGRWSSRPPAGTGLPL
jgi:predicted Zn-dependent protease